MDNIQKMLVGVLSVAGLIALAVPDKSPVFAPPAQSPAEAKPNPAPETPPASLPIQYDPQPSPDVQMGEPSIDGNPIQPDFGMPFGTAAQSNIANVDAGQASQNGQSSQGGYTPPVYSMPGAAPAPASGEGSTTVVTNSR